LSTNNLLEDVLIYSYRSPRIPPYYFINAWDDDFLPLSEIGSLGPQKATWQFDIGPGGTNQMRCYFPVYGGNYSSQAGCVILSVNTGELFSPFQREARNMKILLLRRGETYILRENGFGPVSEEDAALADSLSEPPGRAAEKLLGNIRLVNKLSMGELDGELYFFADLRYFSREDIPALLIPIILLLILLTSILFINFAAGTRRVSALARHFQTADYSNLTPLDRGRYTDEIGFLVDCYNQMAENINHLVHDVYRAELKSRDARYYAIQAQLNPHFLLNSLENIRMIAMMRGDDETSGMIYQLARIMNYTIRQGSLISTLAQETEHCRNYLELCAMRIGPRFSYAITCPGEMAGLVCPKFMLQPIVENAVEHAFTENPPKKHIDITISPRDAGACILIRDNGRGIEAERLAALRELLEGTCSPEEGKIHGIGIINVHERLKIFYGAGYGITVESDPESGTRFTLLIGSRPYPEMTVNQSPQDP
jgi:two-component system sensor histidine kinase YesM